MTPWLWIYFKASRVDSAQYLNLSSFFIGEWFYHGNNFQKKKLTSKIFLQSSSPLSAYSMNSWYSWGLSVYSYSRTMCGWFIHVCMKHSLFTNSCAKSLNKRSFITPFFTTYWMLLFPPMTTYLFSVSAPSECNSRGTQRLLVEYLLIICGSPRLLAVNIKILLLRATIFHRVELYPRLS